MLHITAQVINILLLVIRVAHRDRTFRNGRMGGAVGVTFVIGPDQQAVGHIANKLTADIPPGADTHTLMFNLEIGLIIDITEAQCPGIQRVFIGCRRAANHRTVKLGMSTHRDIKAARTGKDTRLLLHRVKVAVQLVLAAIDTDTARHGARAEAAANAAILLFGVIVIAVLLALQQQVAAHLHLHRFAADLRTDQ